MIEAQKTTKIKTTENVNMSNKVKITKLFNNINKYYNSI